ncbi:MAG: DUF4440 domain-containing protein [Emcibacteraceae bacterium]
MNPEKRIEVLEKLLLQSETRASKTQLDALLADDFTEFGSSGRSWTKNEIIEALTAQSDNPPIRFHTSDFSVKMLSPDAALVRYKCVSKDANGVILRSTLRSSVWRYKNEKWKIYFHQGTVQTE